jgi:hypothetical protein
MPGGREKSGADCARGRQRMRALGLGVAISACLVLGLPGFASAASPKTITIAADAPSVENCWPFDQVVNPDDATDHWTPYFGFVYKNIPAFALKSGDTLAFDLGARNVDHDIQVDIAMAPATNGTDVNTAPFTRVVQNTQTPSNPRGNEVAGDYELGFTAQDAFTFAGGGLIIRISNPGPSFIGDPTCDDSLVGANTGADPSGFFVSRVFTDPDGVSPWADGDSGPISQFRLTLQPTSNSFSFGELIRNKRKGTAMLPVSVPGPGTLALSGNGVKAQTAKAVAGVSVSAAGTLNVPLKPKGKLRKRLRSRHKAKVGLTITFTPSGDPAGDPSTQSLSTKLVKKPR